MKPKVIQKSSCSIGWYTTIGVAHKGSNHIIHKSKPICNCFVNRLADLNVVDFDMSLNNVECKSCKSVWKANEKKRWKNY